MNKKCDNCGIIFKTYKCYEKRKRKHRFCSKKCEFEFRSYNNTVNSWKGGYISTSNGYKYIQYNGGRIEEHRLVMMSHLGRDLLTEEHVHHINGDKLDNRIENLKLTDRWEHSQYHKKNTNKKCQSCGVIKKHKARGYCATCYHRKLMKGEFSIEKKQIQQ